ncbi:P-loop guanosine triphosphatase YjiA [Methylobacterium cerastii]|uniref:P-loop guanosine triphosphatase YjiA n=1 Tax=Methylobacterium cerastii TaxID=932741 RepID=A0ABQ4QCH7_9HYPH|nr:MULTISPECIES: cobalamin biosynthesis protein CobW [Methylobacterium]TXM76737.1 cobalamin biosynthesis protein CobW [Methylobacterium sp. WL12]TXM93175.1 cobalamin biosynthesis protein CobW [Methylobacterium sp. WL103]TXN85029.1 cobalamin biosynthesis protein CobW [Methylobacterium sp. WL8]GJD42791.1 P-loop guanosine triphosphatase YjiA [Methylobacterium cerastii]
MTIVAKIPCTIVTGFLGAGKTTLVRHVVENAGGRRLAILVNEFGDVGFDKSFLAACGIEGCTEDSIVELPNGCICCTVADDFVPAMTALLDRPNPPEHILIETSGLALPKPLVQAFQWPAIRSRVTVDGVVAVVDGPAVASGAFAEDPEALANQRAADTAVDHDNPLEEVFEDQLLCADLVVLNKADMMDAAGLAAVRVEVERQLPRAVKVVETAHGRIDPRVLLGLQAAAEDDLDARPSHHGEGEDHDHDDFETVALPVRTAITAADLAARVEKAAETKGVLRIKGFCAVEGKPMRLVVQGVGRRITHHFDRPWTASEPRDGTLVVIGLKGFDQGAVAEALAG